MADRPSMGFGTKVLTQLADKVLMGVPKTIAMAAKAKMGLGNYLKKKIIASRPEFEADEAYPGELFYENHPGLKPLETEGRAPFAPLIARDNVFLNPKTVKKEYQMSEDDYALPGLVADAYNTILTPGRAMRGDPNANIDELGVNMAVNSMGMGMAFGRVPPGSLAMNAYHGSPHRFPPTAKNPLGEFDPMKVGTGEGAQAYGTGAAYLAEAKNVAQSYADDLAKAQGSPLIIRKAGKIFKQGDDLTGEVLDALKYREIGAKDAGQFPHNTDYYAKKRLAGMSEGPYRDRVLAALNDLKDTTSAYEKTRGSLYKVDLPDDRIAKMLDWDKPLSEQSTAIQEVVRKIGVGKSVGPTKTKIEAFINGTENPEKGIVATGEDLYRAISDYGTDSVDGSKRLQSFGIPGIRYLDQGSRTGGKGTSNFVVFDPADMTILERNGKTAQDVLAQESKGLVPPVQRVAPQDEALRLAQERAALPVEQGGLGLPVDNTPEQRAVAQNSVDYLHGTERLDRLLSGKNLDPKRATSGPMPFGTDSESIASTYAMNKRDTSRMDSDVGDFDQYFQVSPKSLGYRGKIPYSVEKSWYHLSPKVKADILDKSRRIGYKDPKTGEGDWTLHPTSDGLPFSPSHYDYELKNAGGNPLVALRSLYAESGMLDAYAPSELADIYKLAGYPHEISQANAPWTEAKGVFTGKAMLDKPLKTSNIEEIQNIVIPALKKAFEKDRTKTKVSNSDEWSKNSRFTPKQWVNELEKDIAEGNNSYVWTSIPDKVTEQLKKLNYTGIIDTGGKGGGMNEGHQVVIPFNPDDVRSRFAAFDPFRRSAAIAAAMGVAAPDLMADEKQKPAKKNIVPPVKKQGK